MYTESLKTFLSFNPYVQWCIGDGFIFNYIAALPEALSDLNFDPRYVSQMVVRLKQSAIVVAEACVLLQQPCILDYTGHDKSQIKTLCCFHKCCRCATLILFLFFCFQLLWMSGVLQVRPKNQIVGRLRNKTVPVVVETFSGGAFVQTAFVEPDTSGVPQFFTEVRRVPGPRSRSRVHWM